MTGFLLRRLVATVITLLLATFVFHTALMLLPGDPIRALFGPVRPDPEVYAAMREHFHYDQPWYLRYALYLGDLLRGDLGTSFPGGVRNRPVEGPPVSAIIAAAVPVSLRLLLGTLVVQTVVGILAGVLTVHRRAWASHVAYGTALLLVAAPVLVTGFVLQTLAGWELGWFPVGGAFGWSHYVLPILSLSAAATAYVMLVTRAELGETLHAPFIRSARARSVPAARVLGVHGLRASLVPVVTVIAANLGQLLTGLVIVEGIYDMPGVGATMLRALQTRDPSLLVALLLVATALVLVANLVADVLQAVIDPRIRLGR